MWPVEIQRSEPFRGAGENEATDGNENTGGNPSASEHEAMGDLKGSEAAMGKSSKRATPRPPRVQVPSRKNVWMVTDPLGFPPSKYHKSLFRCNQPFVTVSHDLPAYDKFGGLQMKEEVREKAMAFLLRPCIEISRSHGNRGEESGRILHASLFQRIWRIAKPSRRLMKSIDNMEKEYEIQYGARKKPKYEKPVDDDNEDFLSDEIEALKQDEEAGPEAFSSDHSNEILLMGKEAMPDDGEEIGKGRMDLRISVYNNSNLKWKKKFGRRDEVDSRKSVCVVECKWDNEDENAIYQAGCYACQEALKNISNLHLDPIYILVLSKSKWTYGILDLRGKINVLEGGIDIYSFSEFSEQEGIRFSDYPTSVEELEVRLRNGTTYYRQHFSSYPGAVYPPRQFVVGTLHISEEWYSLPDFNSVDGAMRYGVHLFYEGLLRIIIGEKVTEWELEDFEKAKGLKKAVRNQQEELMFGSRIL